MCLSKVNIIKTKREVIKITNGEKIKEIFPDMYQVEQSLEAWDSWWNAEYKEPTTKNDLAQERYQDLIDYFGDKETAKTILEDKKEFKAWLERVKWHVKKADELARELVQLKPTTKNEAKYCDRNICLKNEYNNVGCEDCEVTRSQESTTKNDLGVDCVPRIEVIDYLCKHCPDDGECFKDCDEIKHLRQMPSVTPQPRKGHWIADVDKWGDVVTTVNGYRCDKCNTFNADKDNYCPNCGADMREVEE